MKLIKDEKVVKLPKIRNGVVKTLRDARLMAYERGWDKVIIIGQSKESGAYYTSAMSGNDAIGMLERAKNDLLNN